MELTQYQKILVSMIRQEQHEWWYPYEFMRELTPELFVGYEASARLSELAKMYPTMIASERRGKYFIRRLQRENYNQFIHLLPDDLRSIFDSEWQGQKTLI